MLNFSICKSIQRYYWYTSTWTPLARARISVHELCFLASSACCHNMQAVLVSVEMTCKCWRAHKGWTVLALSHRGERARHRTPTQSRDTHPGRDAGRTRDEEDNPFYLFPSSWTVTSYLPEARASTVFFFFFFLSCLWGRSRAGRCWRCRRCWMWGGRKCERRARTRLRCRESKLAAHLGCRSHLWKMPTLSPSFSSGKTCCCFYLFIFGFVRWMVSQHKEVSAGHRGTDCYVRTVK